MRTADRKTNEKKNESIVRPMGQYKASQSMHNRDPRRRRKRKGDQKCILKNYG